MGAVVARFIYFRNETLLGNKLSKDTEISEKKLN